MAYDSGLAAYHIQVAEEVFLQQVREAMEAANGGSMTSAEDARLAQYRSKLAKLSSEIFFDLAQIEGKANLREASKRIAVAVVRAQEEREKGDADEAEGAGPN